MSCVVGLIDSGAIWMGADSAATYGEGAVAKVKANKIYRSNHALIGMVGSCRAASIMRNAINWEALLPKPSRIRDVEKVVYRAIEAVRTEFLSAGFVTATEGEGQEYAGQFLIAYGGKLFTVASDYSLDECDGPYGAIGNARDIALAALYLTEPEEGVTPASPQDRVLWALDAAAKWNRYVGPPFVVEKLG